MSKFETLDLSLKNNFLIEAHTVCTRANCQQKKTNIVHDHCQGKTSKGKLCKRRPLFNQFCHNHLSQVKCFFTNCHSPPFHSHAYCWNHAIYKTMIDKILYPGSKFEKTMDINLFMEILSFLPNTSSDGNY